MPLLTCPNDSAPMQAVSRSGVELDICPQCRGVWLDRGELEKLMGMARADDAGAPAPAPRTDLRYLDQGYGERGEHGERGDYGERASYGGHGQRRKGRFDIFDIFD